MKPWLFVPEATQEAQLTVRQPHPIEVRSHEVLRSRVDPSRTPPLWRPVTHEYSVDLVTKEEFPEPAATVNALPPSEAGRS